MNVFSFFGFLAGCACLTLGVFTMIRGRGRVQRLWSAFTFAAAIWGFGCYFIGHATDPVRAVFYWKLAYVGVILIPAFILHFAYAFIGERRRITMALVYLGTAAFVGLDLFTGLFIKDVQLLFGQFYYLTNPSVVYNIFVVWFVLVVSYVLGLLLIHFARTADLNRSQTRYVMLALLVGLGGGGLAFLPVYGLDVYPIFNGAIVIGALLVAYATLRHRLMDLRSLAQKACFYLLAALAVYAGFYGVVYLDLRLFGNVYSNNALIAGALFAVVFSLLYAYFLRIVDALLEKHVFVTYHDYQCAINDLAKELNSQIDLRQITRLVVDVISSTMGVRDVKLTFDGAIDPSLPRAFLTRRAQPILKYELEHLKEGQPDETESLQSVATYMEAHGAVLLAPAVSHGGLVALIELGPKAEAEYTQDDWLLLENLAFQVGTAVDKAQMYARLEGFNDELERKVTEQTEDIRAKNSHLQELLAMKTEFLRTAQHQLNTPLSAIRGSLAMMEDGNFTKDEALKHVTEATQRLAQTIDDFWSAYELVGVDLSLRRDKLDIETILKTVLSEPNLVGLAAKKSLTLELAEPGFKVPAVAGEAQMLSRALLGLLDNAVTYTPSGGVTVSLELATPFLKISVRDTGVGIGSEDEKKLFRSFSRGAQGVSEHPDGSGLGLYIAKKSVEGMGGKISYETSPGRGSTFTIALPIYA